MILNMIIKIIATEHIPLGAFLEAPVTRRAEVDAYPSSFPLVEGCYGDDPVPGDSRVRVA
jgi:hypothetical protein